MDSLKGTRDFFPAEMRFRRWLEDRWRGVAESYGYEEVDGPVLDLSSCTRGIRRRDRASDFTV